MPETSISQIFARIQSGDTEAFQQLFSLYYDRIYSTALQYCKVEATAEDIVQEIFLRLWEKRTGLIELKDPEAWLFTIVRNQARDVLRNMAHSDRYKKYAIELIRQEDNSPEKELINRQQKDLLDRSFELLTDKQREVYELSRREGLTYEEIALRLQIGRETVKDHIVKAISKIKQFLSEHRNDFMLESIIALNIFFEQAPLFS